MAPVERGYQLNIIAVMLTYQGFSDVERWRRFLVFWRGKVRSFQVKYWCAILESNRTAKNHCHVMVQFARRRQGTNRAFTFGTNERKTERTNKRMNKRPATRSSQRASVKKIRRGKWRQNFGPKVVDEICT